VITGADTILTNSWTLNGNVYQAVVTKPVSNFFVGHKEQILARYPNDHQYLTLDEGTINFVKDASIQAISAAMVNNSKICVHNQQWCWEKTRVGSVSVDTIKFNGNISLESMIGSGYFLFDNILHLDTAKEWKYDAANQILNYIPPTGQNPNNLFCEVTVDTNGLRILGTASYINISGLSFEKQANAGILIGANAHHITINDCYFARQYNYAVCDSGSYNVVSNSYFREIDGIAVFAASTATYGTISGNTLRNIGEFRSSGLGNQIGFSAIKAGFANNFYIHHNNIDSTGYCAISADGGWHVVEKNIINHAMLINNDGAALKTYGNASHHNIFRNNFISNSDGNTEGIENANFQTPAIYFDFQSNNSSAIDNTIFDRTSRGIFLNSGTYIDTIRGNTIYGFNYGVDLSGGPQTGTAMYGMRVTKNKLFARVPQSVAIREVDYQGIFTGLGYIDSNYYFNPYDAFFAQRSPGPRLSFPTWLSMGNDSNTVISHFSWVSPIDSSMLFINPTDNAVVQNLLGYEWRDLDSNTVTTLTLQPWTSKILIRKNTTTLPVNLVSFNARKSNKDVVCSWQTSREVNLSHFNIQRSVDGRNFSTIGKVNATYTNDVAQYTFTDVNAQGLKADYAYYRLEMVDKDMKVQYSPSERIVWSTDVAVSVYPNPATDHLRVNGADIKSITLFDGNAKVVLQKTNCSDNNVIDLPAVAKGVYWLKVMYGDKAMAQMVIIT